MQTIPSSDNTAYCVRTAYLILAHEDPLQLKALALELTQTSDVFIHINALSDITPFIKALEGIDRAVFIKNRQKIHWGGYSIVKATFELLQAALSNDNYDRIILLTGLDYPVKSMKELSEFFSLNRNYNYVCCNPLNAEIFPFLKNYHYRDNRTLTIALRIIRTIFPGFWSRKNDYINYNGIKYIIYGCAPKWAITGEAARYLLDFYRDNPKFNRHFMYMHAPDDLYIATVLNASPFKDTLITDRNIFFVKWLPDNKGAKKLDASDFDDIAASGMLYAKKFYSSVSGGLISELHRHYENDKQI